MRIIGADIKGERREPEARLQRVISSVTGQTEGKGQPEALYLHLLGREKWGTVKITRAYKHRRGAGAHTAWKSLRLFQMAVTPVFYTIKQKLLNYSGGPPGSPPGVWRSWSQDSHLCLFHSLKDEPCPRRHLGAHCTVSFVLGLPCPY